MTKLNYGCGERKFEGYINIDIEPSTKPDLICDLRTQSFSFESNSVDEIMCLHNIEHIEIQFWPHIFTEFRRVLKNDCPLVLMYPEFEICSKFFLENKYGMRELWRACLYGRQLYPGDYHVVPMVSSELSNHLGHCGFYNIKWLPEDDEPQYTIMRAFKNPQHLTKENIIRKEVFGLEFEVTK